MASNVLVVGAGPVGLTAAIELTRFGVPVRIVDKLKARTDKSKALVVWSRTLELMERGGVSEALVAAGNKVSGTRLISAGKELARISLGGVASRYNFALLIPQDETERVLEEHLNGLGVFVERQVELTELSQDKEGITATLSRTEVGVGNKTETFEAEWLIGCDGAHSPVRHALGKTFDGSTSPTNFILADVHLRGADLPQNEISMFAHAEGLLQLFPIRADRFRVIADLGAASEERRADPTLAEVQAIIERRGPSGLLAFDPIWLASFRVNERKVEDYRSGRVFLAGDAAHIHSPAGGQGMNTGMQDVCNLAWKLALVTHGRCGQQSLLPSYSVERSPIAAGVLRESGLLQEVMTLRNPALQAVRNFAASVLFGFAPGRAKMAETMSELSVGYPVSPLTQAAWHGGTGPRAGARAPLREGERPVGAGKTAHFALFAGPGVEHEELAQAFPELVEPALRAPFDDGGLWLVRPDGYVGVVASEARTVRAYLKALI